MKYTFLEKTTHELQDETIFIIFAELKRFNKSEEECATALDKLLYLFKNIGEMEDDENWHKDSFWQRFFRACEIAASDEKKRAQYEQDMYDERRFQGQLAASYKNGLEAGIAEGREKGREEGRAEGREAGLAEGLEKGREAERLEMAKKMLAEGIPVDVVAKCSGLSAEGLTELK